MTDHRLTPEVEKLIRSFSKGKGRYNDARYIREWFAVLLLEIQLLRTDLETAQARFETVKAYAEHLAAKSKES